METDTSVHLNTRMRPFLRDRIRTVGLGTEQVLLRRVTGSGLGGDLTPRMVAEPKLFISLQLTSINHQESWRSGKFCNNLPYLEGSIDIMHLDEQPQNLVPGPFDCVHLEASDDALRHFAEADHSRPVSRLRCEPGVIDPLFASLGAALLPAFEKDAGLAGPVEQLFVDQIAFALLTHALHAYGASPAPSHMFGGISVRQQRRVLDILTADLRHDPSLADMARECGMPISRFTKAFRLTFGKSPSQWLRRHRIDRARDLLFLTMMPIREIADMCGFADQSHFSRVFLSSVGITPARYRRER